ncbi:bifunctional 4-hydroxy-3-methylbut-2-enyl diphosphate reductase/30S ribosomal protein S1 [Anaerococcus jeddahensis]|uniref:bifunctional 4-hydroxy-3-methylbut-2-enyl diphosphate reductase/30S ribosomal protein S1 n=1 Tax=Anaerococcus jeddahensis TaxID=1673719 RepID=UPI0006723D43|nr:bifunctional 4-hydroxy-3-methylbut-2-enyl diphosphate reductase/30S ribosomal protein S1 [Anaerococcus jeddahensis]
MKIIVAKNSGFCNGVRRSVDLANKTSGKNIKSYTLGPLVHNPTQVKMLEEKGVGVIDEKEALNLKNSQIVIRSHGVSEKLKDDLRKNSNDVIDATCPVLINIYKKIKEKENEGYTIIIIGDKDHPEIKAMASYVNNGIIIKNETEAKNITNMSKLYVVSQTTNRIDFFENIAHELEKTNDDVVIENTICNATRLRQEACKSLSKEVDCMIVVGGFNSSNTNKLYQIAQKYCKNVKRIETVKDLPLQKLSNFNIIGVIAGASTPDQVIEEVVNRMDDLTNEELMNSIEDSMKKIYPRDVINGTIIDVKDDEVFVDIQYRADGIVKLDEMSEEQRENPKDHFEIGQEVEVYVIKIDDGEGNVALSTRRVEGMKNWKTLREAFENEQTVEGEISGANKGGLTARVMGINGFVPASQIAPYFVKNFKKFVGEHWDLKIISIDERKNRLVLSRKDIVEEKLDEQWDELEEGQVITGKVARLTDFGAFVEIGSLDGLLHVSDISWTRVEHPRDVLNIGDDIEVKILKLNKEKNRISLGRKQLLEKPFAEFANEHEVGDVITGKVVNLLDFGAFVEVSEGVEGLIHVSEISWDHVEKPSDELNVGDEVEVKILSIDPEEEKIGLSIKALKEAPERSERKPRRNFEENKNRSNAKAKRKAEKKELNNEFGDNDLNNNIGFAIEEVLSGIEIED